MALENPVNSVVSLMRAIEACPLIDSRLKSEANFLARLILSPRLSPALARELGGDWRTWLWG